MILAKEVRAVLFKEVIHEQRLDGEDEEALWAWRGKAEVNQYQLTEKRKCLAHLQV